VCITKDGFQNYFRFLTFSRLDKDVQNFNPSLQNSVADVISQCLMAFMGCILLPGVIAKLYRNFESTTIL
jgi:VanZ family protein